MLTTTTAAADMQVKNTVGQWVDAPPVPGTFVCNIGDMFKVRFGSCSSATAVGYCSSATVAWLEQPLSAVDYEACMQGIQADTAVPL